MNLINLPTRDENGALLAVVETPRGAAAKFKYEPAFGTFELHRPLVLGVTYPYDWGFFPSTLAADGDPLDVMVVHAATSHPGVVIRCQAVAVLKVSQKGPTDRTRVHNDRIIAVPVTERRVPKRQVVNARVRQELEQFFLNAVFLENKKVRLEGWDGVRTAEAIIRAAETAHRDRLEPS